MKSREELEEMSKANLVNYGQSLDPPVEVSGNKPEMVDQLLEAMEKESSVSNDTGKGLPKLGKLRDLTGKEIECDMVRLRISSTESNKGPVDVQINGYNWRIKRDEWVVVPAPVVEVLKNSTINTVEQDDDGKNRRVRVTNHPFQSEPASEEDVAKQKAEQEAAAEESRKAAENND